MDEILTLWEGRLSLKLYLPLKAPKFDIKTLRILLIQFWTFMASCDVHE
jgi:hypothetical protein